MRRFLIPASLLLALPLSLLPAQAADMARCSASTPRINPPPNVPLPPDPANPPSPNWQPIASAGGCTTQFQVANAARVVAKLHPDPGFTGTLGLRVAGTNALFAEFSASYVNGQMVNGIDTQEFNIFVGTWRLDVFLGGPTLPGNNKPAVGTYSGSVSPIAAAPTPEPTPTETPAV